MTSRALRPGDLPGTAHIMYRERLSAGLDPFAGYDPHTGVLAHGSHAYAAARARHRSRHIDSHRRGGLAGLADAEPAESVVVGRAAPLDPADRSAARDDLRAILRELSPRERRALLIAGARLTGESANAAFDDPDWRIGGETAARTRGNGTASAVLRNLQSKVRRKARDIIGA